MVSAAMESALNRPIWSALTTGDRRFAEGGALALRFPPDIAPFAATAEDSPEAFAALRELLAEDGASLWLRSIGSSVIPVLKSREKRRSSR
jgi:hypothetical protein